MIEWLAYHYHVINLRNLIITADPKCRTSPKSALERWKDKMNIEYWEQSDYLDTSILTRKQKSSKLEFHRHRQSTFIVKCLQEFKKQDKGWVLLSDTDEFVTINPKLRDKADSKMYVPGLPSIREPGSIMTFLNSITIPDERYQAFAPCIPIFRQQFSSRPSTEKQIGNLVPSGFEGNDFLTLRWRKFGAKARWFTTVLGENCGIRRKAGPVKTVIDLSRFRIQDLYHEDVTGNPHMPVESVCSKYDVFTPEGKVGLTIFHYLGTLPQWTYRVTDTRGAGYRNARFEDMNENIGLWESDELREWLVGFVEQVGIDEAKRLLKDVGKLEPLSNNDALDSSSVVTTEQQATPSYKVGDIVLVNWRGHGDWYWAHVTRVFDGGFYNVIMIEDCSEDLGVSAARLKNYSDDISEINVNTEHNFHNYKALMQQAAKAQSKKKFSVGYSEE